MIKFRKVRIYKEPLTISSCGKDIWLTQYQESLPPNHTQFTNWKYMPDERLEWFSDEVEEAGLNPDPKDVIE